MKTPRMRSLRDPGVFRCVECGDPMHWIPDDPGVLLHCWQLQCADALMPVQVWRAQQHRENLGLDAPSPAAGWRRPRLDGLPVPYLTPVTNGHPWWGLIHRGRLHACQVTWLCQICGLALDRQAWVLLRHNRVITNSAMHQRCLDLARPTCPRLADTGTEFRAAEVTASQLRTVNGEPIGLGIDYWPEYWLLADSTA